MAKIQFKFTDESGTNLNRYIATNVSTGEEITFDLLRGGKVNVIGTPLNAENLNALITAINEAYDEISDSEQNTTYTIGKNGNITLNGSDETSVEILSKTQVDNINDIPNKASTTQLNEKSTADRKYADDKKAEAIKASNGYADTQKGEAVKESNAYTDKEIKKQTDTTYHTSLCSHEYEITGQTGETQNVAVETGNVEIPAIYGRTEKCYNLFKIEDDHSHNTSQKAINGVWYDITNGVITLNGTVTKDFLLFDVVLKEKLPNGKYTLVSYTSNIKSSNKGYFDVTDNPRTKTLELFLKEEVSYLTGELPNNLSNWWFRCALGDTYKNTIFRIMVLKGEYQKQELPIYTPYYNGLKSAMPKQLVSGNENLWDEQWEVGYLSSSEGTEVDEDRFHYIRSSNFCPILPEENYTFYVSTEQDTNIFIYDKYKNYIGVKYSSGTFKFMTPKNSGYFKVAIASSDKKYHNNAMIIHAKNNKNNYSPHEEHILNIEAEKYFPNGMRSAGDMKDEITPKCAIQRVNYIPDLSKLWWGETPYVEKGYYTDGIRKLPNGIFIDYDNPKFTCNRYMPTSWNDRNKYPRTICMDSNGLVFIRDVEVNSEQELRQKLLNLELTVGKGTPIITNFEKPLDWEYFVWKNGSEQQIVPEGYITAEVEKVYPTSLQAQLKLNYEVDRKQQKEIDELQNKVYTTSYTDISNSESEITGGQFYVPEQTNITINSFKGQTRRKSLNLCKKLSFNATPKFSNAFYLSENNLKPNTKYTIVFECKNTGAKLYRNENLFNEPWYVTLDGNTKIKTLTTKSDILKQTIIFSNSEDNTGKLDETSIYNFQILEGEYTLENIPAFSPYDDTLINAKADFVSTDKNIFDPSLLNKKVFIATMKNDYSYFNMTIGTDKSFNETPLTTFSITSGELIYRRFFNNKIGRRYYVRLGLGGNKQGVWCDVFELYLPKGDIVIETKLLKNDLNNIELNFINIFLAKTAQGDIIEIPYTGDRVKTDLELGAFDEHYNDSNVTKVGGSGIINAKDLEWATPETLGNFKRWASNLETNQKGAVDYISNETIPRDYEFSGDYFHQYIFGYYLYVFLPKETTPQEYFTTHNFQFEYKLATPTYRDTDIVPNGMSVWDKGMQYQDHDNNSLPYIEVSKSYAMGVIDQVLKNIDINKGQQEQIDELNSKVNSNEASIPNKVDKVTGKDIIFNKNVSDTDLDTIKQTGFYYCTQGNTNTPTEANYWKLIVNGAGVLENNEGDCFQIASKVNEERFYIRSFGGVKWTEWKEISNDTVLAEIAKKQDTLVGEGEGQNVKTINGESILGGGNIEVKADPYTLPKATASSLGGVMVGDGLSISEEGVLSATGGGGSTGSAYYNPNDISLFGLLPDNELNLNIYNKMTFYGDTDLEIDWGDGKVEKVQALTTAQHIYSEPYKKVLIKVKGKISLFNTNPRIDYISLGQNAISGRKTFEGLEKIREFTGTLNITSESFANSFKTFFACSSLLKAPFLDTSNCKNFTSMFANCSSLEEIPQYNTSQATFMDEMFKECYKLTSIPVLDSSKVITTDSMFANCSSLLSVPLLDMTKATTANNMFLGCTNLLEANIINLNTSLDISPCTKLMKKSLMTIIENLASNPKEGTTLTLGTALSSKLTEQEKQIATNKGWKLA